MIVLGLNNNDDNYGNNDNVAILFGHLFHNRCVLFFCIDSGFYHPLLKKVPGCLWKSGSEKRENNYFFKTQHKRRQCFWHRYIYNNNKSIYIKVIKKV